MAHTPGTSHRDSKGNRERAALPAIGAAGPPTPPLPRRAPAPPPDVAPRAPANQRAGRPHLLPGSPLRLRGRAGQDASALAAAPALPALARSLAYPPEPRRARSRRLLALPKPFDGLFFLKKRGSLIPAGGVGRGRRSREPPTGRALLIRLTLN